LLIRACAGRTQYEATQIGSSINAVQKEIGQIKKAKGDATDLLKQKDDLTKKKAAQEELAKSKLVTLQALAKTVGNYVHESVPVSGTEDDNAEVKVWAPEGVDVKNLKKPLSHHEVG
jgi:seryl-tRNA synthetase